MIRRIDDVRCITIVHPLHEIRKYRECSAFFRLLGIFVYEKILGEENGDPTDHQIILSNGADGNPDVNSIAIINDMAVGGVITIAMKTLFFKLYGIYSANDLMRASYAIAYFFDTKTPYIYTQMYGYYERFGKALSDLEKLEVMVKNPAELKYIWAAKSNCKRRMNELYTYIWKALEKDWYTKDEEEKNALKQKLWEQHFFSLEEINKDVLKILDYEEDFYGAYAIRGFALELDRDHRFESVVDLLNAVKYTGKKSYASYIYYRIGKYCEAIRGNLSQKWEYYQLSWELDSRNYRALYKIALKEKIEGRLDSAEELWKRLIKILHPKKHSNALQPIECAYLYKTYILLGDIKIRKEAFLEGIQYFQKAEEVYNNQSNEDKIKGFYPWMFGSNVTDPGKGTQRWEIYKDAAREKLQIKVLYKRIANAAADAGLKELYDKYYPRTLDE